MRYNDRTRGQVKKKINFQTGEVYTDWAYEHQEIQRRLEEKRTRNKKIESLKRKIKARIANTALLSLVLALTTVGISYTQIKDKIVEGRGGVKSYNYATGGVIYSGEKVKSEEVFERMIQNAKNTIEEIESKFDFSEGRGM